MDNSIELISDGQGIAVIGEPNAVEQFLHAEGLPSRELGLIRLRSLTASGSAIAQAGSDIAANSGRWVKLTKESARTARKLGLRESSKSGLSTGVFKGGKGQIKGFVEFVNTPGSILSNPAVLAGAASMMAQLAMQQAMDEITDYLAVIDEKVDDILRAQEDTVIARMIGVGLVLDETMTLRKNRGRVDEITWSKVQNAPAIIAETQAYALRQLDSLAEKLEAKTKMGDVAKAAKWVESQVQQWLAVLARCFQLQDGIAVLELDRVFDANPDDLEGHRRGLKQAREDRLDLIFGSTGRLVERMSAAATSANTKVLLHPTDARGIVESRNLVTCQVVDFHRLLAIETERSRIEARRWREAATEARERALEAGGDRVETARRLGGAAADRARTKADAISARVNRRVRRPQQADASRKER